MGNKKESTSYKYAGTDIGFGTALMTEPNTIFVFGSNLNGSHGGGAARQAFDMYEAEWGVGEGLTGRTYAFPTLNKRMMPLTAEEFKEAVKKFTECVKQNSDKVFILTAVGTGIANLPVEEIAEFFRDVPEEVIFPDRFLDALNLDRSPFEKNFIEKVQARMGKDWLKIGHYMAINCPPRPMNRIVREAEPEGGDLWEEDTVGISGDIEDREFDTALNHLDNILKGYAAVMQNLQSENPEAYAYLEEKLSPIMKEAEDFAYYEVP